MATNRNRVIYQSEALFCADVATADVSSGSQLLRVQDISHGVEMPRQDVNEFGQLAAVDRVSLEPPTVSLEFSYYVHGGRNETILGFKNSTGRNVDSTAGLSGAIGDFLTDKTGKNYYISVSAEGTDAKVKSDGDVGVVGIGNGHITSYSVEAAVGDMPSASVSVEAANINFSASGATAQNPAINLATGAKVGTTVEGFDADGTGTNDGAAGLSEGERNPVFCIKPGDIIVDFNDKGNTQPGTSSTSEGDTTLGKLGGAILEGTGQMHLQNFTLDLPLARTALTRLGNAHPYARELDTPITATFTCSAFIGDFQEGNLADLLCADGEKRNIRVKMLTGCGSDDDSSMVQEFLLKGCTLDSQNFSNAIGDNKTVDLVWSAQIGSADDKENGLFMLHSDADDSVGSYTSGEAVENPTG